MGRNDTSIVKSRAALLLVALLLISFVSSNPTTAVADVQTPGDDPDEARTPAAVLTILKTPDTQTIIRGSTATFTINVLNTSPDVNLTNVTVTDPAAPDCNRNIGNLAANSNFPPYQCVLNNVQNAFTNTIQVQGTNPLDNSTESASSQATVEILDLDVEVIATPDVMMEPGGEISFAVAITNTGSVDTTLQSLNSAQYGNLLAGVNPNVQNNSCVPDPDLPLLAADGGSFNCSFTASVNGQPENYNIVVTAVAEDADSNTINRSGLAEITLSNVAASIEVSLVANPDRIETPGGSINLTVNIQNTSAVDSVIIDTLTENVLGNLHEQGDCFLPQEISVDSSYTCSYSDDVMGDANDSETRTIIATGIDDDIPANNIEKSGQDTVFIIAPAEYTIFMPMILDHVNEPNNVCAEAYPITVNQNYYFFANDIEDWYWFDLDSQGNLLVSLSNFIPKLGQIVVYKGNTCSTLNVLGNNGNADGIKQVPLGTQTAGRYYVRIFNDGSLNSNDPYKLIIEFE